MVFGPVWALGLVGVLGVRAQFRCNGVGAVFLVMQRTGGAAVMLCGEARVWMWRRAIAAEASKAAIVCCTEVLLYCQSLALRARDMALATLLATHDMLLQ